MGKVIALPARKETANAIDLVDKLSALERIAPQLYDSALIFASLHHLLDLKQRLMKERKRAHRLAPTVTARSQRSSLN